MTLHTTDAIRPQRPSGTLGRGRRARADFLADLRQAVADLDFRLEYQAQFSLLTGRATSFEALIRWRHPTRGDVPPALFIPAAERVGLISRIGRWVLEQACAEAATWPPDIRVAVNVSAAQLGPDFLPIVLSALAQAGLPPERLELEVTETAFMPPGETGLAVLRSLRAAGVGIAIDDFDVGYASFSYLIGFPFDRLKIDGSLVSHIGTDHGRAPVARAVIRSISTLCRELGVLCGAEGVETVSQLEALREAGCTDVQGFLLAPPVKPTGIPELLRRTDHYAPPANDDEPGDVPDIPLFQILESVSDVIIVTDAYLDPPGPRIVYVNPAFTRLTGFTATEAIGQSPRFLQGPGTSRRTLEKIGVALRAGEAVHERVLNFAKNGAPYWLDLRIVALRARGDAITHFAAIQRDVTADKRRSGELEDLADRDSLTGIPNRRALLRSIEAEVATAHHQLTAQAGTNGPSLAMIDIDHFKQINDTLGHQTGDAVLFGLADRLAESIRRTDVFGRLGGEEFAICMPHVTLANAVELAEGLRRAVGEEPFDTPNGPVRITVSIGVAELARGGDAQDLMKRADLALHHAKRGGRNSVQHQAQA